MSGLLPVSFFDGLGALGSGDEREPNGDGGGTDPSTNLFDLTVAGSTVLVFGGTVSAFKCTNTRMRVHGWTRKISLGGPRAVERCPSPQGSRHGTLFFARMTLNSDVVVSRCLPSNLFSGTWCDDDGDATIKIGNMEFSSNPAEHELDAFDETNCTHSTDLG